MPMRKTPKLRLPDEIATLVRGMHPDLKRKVKGSLQTILSEPYSGKFLKDELEGLRSFRVSRFRIIYRISEKQMIEVVAIGPRERIYERIASRKNHTLSGVVASYKILPRGEGSWNNEGVSMGRRWVPI
jgi:mRNA interferase RelE/StbE